MDWTPWEILESGAPFNLKALQETLDGGQAFRWNWQASLDCWEGVWQGNVARLQLDATCCLKVSFPRGLPNGRLAELKSYLRADVDWQETIDQLPWRSDRHLRACLEDFQGLRLLNQPFDETLLAFLCSATKQIPQIKIMCENMAQALGETILDGIKTLPTWQKLSETSEEALRQLGLGFRAKNIKKTADLIAEDPRMLKEIEGLAYQDAKKALMAFPGVGEKIADCALLFGAGKWEAFPVDTWILKTLAKRYQLDGWNSDQLARFGRIHFGPYAGLAQQFLFSWERAQER